MFNQGKPIEIHSPIATMPFGKFKGEKIYNIHMNNIQWMKNNFKLSDQTKKTFDDAMDMFTHRGEYAILRQYFDKDNIKGLKWVTLLQRICKTEKEAKTYETQTPEYRDFAYHII